jgi:hypothetical protein
MYHGDTPLRMPDHSPQPMSPEEATTHIREIASGEYDLWLTKHAKEKMIARDVFTPDVRHLLKFGTIARPGEVSTQAGIFKYRMESKTPNSENRTLALIVAPSTGRNVLKVLTVFWANEIN